MKLFTAARHVRCTLLVLALVSQSVVVAQLCDPPDLDCDGIDDALEQALAEKFAPEWRFHSDQPNEDSQQDKNEIIYPSSVEQWLEDVVTETGVHPHVELMLGGDVDSELDIMDIDELDDLTLPLVDDYDAMRIGNYPTQMNGDPDNFPTYYRCDKATDGRIKICYLLFYPYDDKRVEIPGIGTDIDIADHRSDWSGINVKIGGIADYWSVNSVTGAWADTVWYGGHGNKRYILTSSQDYYHDAAHPRIYVSSGSHTCFPRPGEWHNFDVGGFWGWLPGVDNFDDMFAGDGLVVQSWSSTRELINLGDKDTEIRPLVGWLQYPGQWGPDGDPSDETSSPKGPTTKGEWAGNTATAFEWEDLLDENDSYNEDFEETATPVSSGWFSDGDPQVVLFNDNKWQGEPGAVLGPGEYPNGQAWAPIISMLRLGQAQVLLFEQPNFGGPSTLLTRSSPQLQINVQSFIVLEPYGNGQDCDVVLDVDHVGIQNGSWTNPYTTVSDGVDAVPVGGTICIKSGTYPENLLIEKPLTMRTYFGSSLIGQ